MTYHALLPHFGSVALMLSHQQRGQVTSECLHQTEKRINTKARNSLGDKVKEALTEVKMSGMRKRTTETNEKKTYQGTDRVTVLGLVCTKNGRASRPGSTERGGQTGETVTIQHCSGTFTSTIRQKRCGGGSTGWRPDNLLVSYSQDK